MNLVSLTARRIFRSALGAAQRPFHGTRVGPASRSVIDHILQPLLSDSTHSSFSAGDTNAASGVVQPAQLSQANEANRSGVTTDAALHVAAMGRLWLPLIAAMIVTPLPAKIPWRHRRSAAGSLAQNDVDSLLRSPVMLQSLRGMNRNARRPKSANHGKRPVCNQRRRAKNAQLRSRAYKKKIFGFW